MPPYALFSEVVEKMNGLQRLREYLKGHAEDLAAVDDEDDHPYFDSQLLLVQREIDGFLDRAGFVTPVATTITDPMLRNAAIALTIDRLTEADSSREAWIDKYVAGWRKWLGEVVEDPSIVTGLVSAESGGDLALAESVFTEVPQFQTGEPYAQVDQVFVSLGNPRRWW